MKKAQVANLRQLGDQAEIFIITFAIYTTWSLGSAVPRGLESLPYAMSLSKETLGRG